MRYKPNPQPDVLPVALDATDLDMLAELAGPGSKVVVETEDHSYDGADDLVKHRRWGTKLERLTITLDDGAEFGVIPQSPPHGERAKRLAEQVEVVLDRRRRRLALAVMRTVAVVVVVFVGLAFTVGLELAGALGIAKVRGEFHWSDVNLSWWKLVTVIFWISAVRMAATIPPFFLSHRIIPTRRLDSFWRQYSTELVTGAVAAAVSVVVTTLITSAIS